MTGGRVAVEPSCRAAQANTFSQPPSDQPNGAALYQFYHLRYNPADQLPTARNYQTGAAFVQYLAEYPGDVYVPYHTQYAVMAGKQAFAHQAALWDVLRGEGTNRGKQMLAREIEETLRARRFDAIILDGDGQWNFLYGLGDFYTLQSDVLPPDYGPTPLTGWQISPRLIFLPKTDHQSAFVLPKNGVEYVDKDLILTKLFPFLNISRRFV